MFIHQSQLAHLLKPEHYTSEDQYRAELRHVFRPAWHPVAAVQQLPRPGDFRTFDLLGEPLLLRNCDGDIRAFLNVCPHRHSRLSSQPAGHADSFQCQYHGWEFDADGRTGKIPDARAFRPWDRENSCLTRFRTERCGDMVFVCLDDAAPGLRESVGPLFEPWAAGYGRPYRFAAYFVADFPCNWKVVLENSLESYHIPKVHPKTFKTYPDEPACEHVLEPGYSTFTAQTPRDYATWIMRQSCRLLGVPITNQYEQHVVHPHVSHNRLDVHRMLQFVEPTSATTCRYHNYVFGLDHYGRNPLKWAVGKILGKTAASVARKITREDAAIYGEVQKGSGRQPAPRRDRHPRGANLPVPAVHPRPHPDRPAGVADRGRVKFARRVQRGFGSALANASG